MFTARKNGRISTLPRKPNFARYLRDARMKRGLSVVEVAEQVGVSTASVYLWETITFDHGCEFECPLQGAEAAGQGDAGDGSGIISVRHSEGDYVLHAYIPTSDL